MSTIAIGTPSYDTPVRSEFGRFLRTLRRRIPPSAVTIGRCERPPTRYGRRVTQEEAAELIGVSRTWYRMLECGVNVRASTRVIDRLANTFAFTPDERRRLFILAMPELDVIFD